VEKGRFKNKDVAVKHLLDNDSEDVEKVFAKEALILKYANHENIVNLIGVCEKPIAIMMEYLEFSFVPFGTDLKANSLSSLLKIMDKNGFTSALTNLYNKIALDVINGLCYLHQHDTVHRDIKPSNILVSNLHYTSLGPEKAGNVFEDNPINCKLADLGEARSNHARTHRMIGNTNTKFLKRGTLGFMAPEIVIEEFMLTSADLNALKAIDIWAALMTFFVLLNPDQPHPFYHDMDAAATNTPEGKYLVMPSDQQLKSYLRKKAFPTSSPGYIKEQASSHSKLRQIVNHGMSYESVSRWSAEKIQGVLKENETIEFFPLTVSQASVLEQSDMLFVRGLPTPSLKNDGSNACAYLSIGIIDKLISSADTHHKCNIDHLKKVVTDVILDFPEKFNDFRDPAAYTDALTAQILLSSKGLLRNEFELEEKLFNNEFLHSFNAQSKVTSTLEELVRKSKVEETVCAAVMHVGLYIFSLAAFTDGFIAIIETHPIVETLNGNGNGIVVKSKSVFKIWQWIIKRLNNSGVSQNTTPSLMCVHSR